MSRPTPTSITITQIAASALAASSAAFAASYLGVAGTIIGAALASVIATVASAMYSASLQRTAALVRPRYPSPGAAPVVIAPEPADDQRLRAGGWGRIALAAVAVLAITLGSVTGIEKVLGQPLSALLGGADPHGTSLGAAVSGSGTRSTAIDPKVPATPVTTPSEAPTSVPSTSPTTAPTAVPTGATDPTPAPTGAPTSDPTSGPTSDPSSGPTPGTP